MDEIKDYITLTADQARKIATDGIKDVIIYNLKNIDAAIKQSIIHCETSVSISFSLEGNIKETVTNCISDELLKKGYSVRTYRSQATSANIPDSKTIKFTISW